MEEIISKRFQDYNKNIENCKKRIQLFKDKLNNFNKDEYLKNRIIELFKTNKCIPEYDNPKGWKCYTKESLFRLAQLTNAKIDYDKYYIERDNCKCYLDSDKQINTLYIGKKLTKYKDFIPLNTIKFNDNRYKYNCRIYALSESEDVNIKNELYKVSREEPETLYNSLLNNFMNVEIYIEIKNKNK